MARIERDFVEHDRLQIEVGGEKVTLNPENVHCIIHAVGKVALDDIVRNSSDFDHVRVVTRRFETKRGVREIYSYLFRGADDDMLFDSEGFEKVFELLKEMGVPVDFNVQEVDDAAIKVFYDHIDNSSHLESEKLDEALENIINGSTD